MQTDIFNNGLFKLQGPSHTILPFILHYILQRPVFLAVRLFNCFPYLQRIFVREKRQQTASRLDL